MHHPHRAYGAFGQPPGYQQVTGAPAAPPAPLGGRFGPLAAAIVPHPILRPLVGSLPGGDPRGLQGTWTDWLGSPAGVVTTVGVLVIVLPALGKALDKR